MKIKIDKEKITTSVRAKIKYLPVLIIGIIIITFGILTYLALFPGTNAEQMSEGEARIKSLDVRFNLKLLNELGTTKSPIQLGTAGGRDPFSGF